MSSAKREMLEQLKLEVDFIEKGGYHPSVRAPRTELRLFRDSVSCPNLGLEQKSEPCSHCYLMEFVPLKFRDRDDACRYIPLNDRGETIDSLEAEGRHEKAQEELLGWLRRSIAQVERQLAEEQRGRRTPR